MRQTDRNQSDEDVSASQHVSVCIISPQKGVCSCVYCCDGVEEVEEEVLGVELLARRDEGEESDSCSSSSFFKYSSLRANSSL